MVCNAFDQTTETSSSDSRCHHHCSDFLSRLAPKLSTVAFSSLSVAASWLVHLATQPFCRLNPRFLLAPRACQWQLCWCYIALSNWDCPGQTDCESLVQFITSRIVVFFQSLGSRGCLVSVQKYSPQQAARIPANKLLQWHVNQI